MRKYKVTVFFNDGSKISVDCDDFNISEKGVYYAVRDNIKIMTFPFSGVKYTVTAINENEDCNNEQVD